MLKILLQIIKEEKKIIIFVILPLFLLTRFWGIGIIRGDSMNPSFYHNDLFLYEKTVSDLDYDDVLLVEKSRSKVIIKRIVALPGDHLVITDGIIYVNGHKSNAEYEYIENSDDEFDVEIAEGHVYLLGDNRQDSLDSRSVGQFSIDHIHGRVRGTPFSF